MATEYESQGKVLALRGAKDVGVIQEEDPKPKKPPITEIYEELAWGFAGILPDRTSFGFPPYEQLNPSGSYIRIIKNNTEDGHCILEVMPYSHGRTNVYKRSDDYLTERLSWYIEKLKEGCNHDPMFQAHWLHCRAKDITEIRHLLLIRHYTKMVFEEEIHPALFLTQPGATWLRLDFDPIPCSNLDDAPAWAEIKSRSICNFDGAAAYLYSVFLSGASRQQHLWVQGDGQDSKSSLDECLSMALGEAYFPTEVETAINDPYWVADLEGKRLVLFREAGKKFISCSRAKTLTGDAWLTGRSIYKARRKFKNNCMVIYMSNDLPEITATKANLRRLILWKLATYNGPIIDNYAEILFGELPWLLGYGKHIYEENGCRIPVDEAPALECAMSGNEYELSCFDKYFFHTGNDYDKVPANIVQQKMGYEFSGKPARESAIAAWMTILKITKVPTKTGTFYLGMRLK